MKMATTVASAYRMRTSAPPCRVSDLGEAIVRVSVRVLPRDADLDEPFRAATRSMATLSLTFDGVAGVGRRVNHKMRRQAQQGLDLWAEETGSGPAVFFIHGGIGDSRLWEPVAGLVSERFRSIRYDQRFLGVRPDQPKCFSGGRCGRRPRSIRH
jgi:hypothetical protein